MIESRRYNRRGGAFLETVGQDLRFGGRGLLRDRGFTITALLTLALGIGANTAIFSIVDGVLLRPLPYRDPARLVAVWPEQSFLRAEYALVRERSRSFSALGGYEEGVGFSLSQGGDAVRVAGTRITASLLPLLGVAPAGRAFTAAEEEAGRGDVVLLSHRLWRDRFGSADRVVGMRLIIDGLPHTVVGIMPRGIAFPNAETDLYVPLTIDPTQIGYSWGVGGTRAIGRLRPGVSAEQAQAELQQLTEELRLANPLWTPKAPYRADATVEPLQSSVVGNARTMLLVLLGAVALVLLIACANVGNLFLARGLARERELAVRAALGAGRARLVRQLVTESALLSLVGGLLGLALGWLALDGLLAILPAETPRLSEVRIDGRVLAVTLLVSLCAGLAFGMFPALRIVRAQLTGSMQEGARAGSSAARRRLSSGIVVAEVALAVVLVAGAGLLLRTLQNLGRVDPGFTTEQAAAARLSPPANSYRDATRRLAFYDDVLERLRAVPGVRSVAVTGQLPFDGELSLSAAAVEFVADDPNELPVFELRSVTPDYFQTMGIPLLAGQGFSSADRAAGLPVAIVDQETAQKFWPGESALGKRIGRPWLREWRTIVGVAGSVRNNKLTGERGLALYLPFAQEPRADAVIVVRSSLGIAALGNGIRAAVRAADPVVPVSDLRTLDAMISRSTAAERAAGLLIGLFALLATVLGAIGLYGVMSYSVTQRARELGVRSALGATRSQILRLVIGHGMSLGLTGLALGIPAALLLGRALRSLLFGVQAADPMNLLLVSALLMTSCLAAAALPAWRAVRRPLAETLRG